MKFVRRKESGGAAPVPPSPPSAPRMPRRKTSGSGSGGEKKSKGGGRQKFVLFLGDEGAILIYMRGPTVVRRLFAASSQPDHTGAILDLMRANPNVPLYVLADVLDQQYVRHSFPPVSALSVNNLVNRRISRDFQPEDLTGSIRLGREKTGRKEWQYLLIALAGTPLLQQWVDLLVEQPNELKGIYLSPVEGQRFISVLHSKLTKEKPVPWQLLVSHHKVSGFRQIVLREGKLVFTRVTQAIDDAVPAVIAGNIEQEIMNTLEYLRRLGFENNPTLEIIVIAAPEVGETLDINRFKVGQQFVLSPLDVADALGLNQAALSADRFGDVVMGASFAYTGKPVMRLLTAYGKKLSQLYMGRLAVKVIGALLVLWLLGSSAMNVLNAISSQGEAQKIDVQRQPIQEQLKSVRRALDGLNKNVAFKSAVMLTYDAYMKNLHTPEEFINALSPLLTPQARIRSINWGLPGIFKMAAIAPAPGSTAPQPAPNAAPATDLEIAVNLEIGGEFATTEELAAFVETFFESVKAGMPEYVVTHAPYAWEGKVESNLEISFDQQQPEATAVAEGSNKITLFFAGPKPVPAGGAAPVAPTPAEPGMMP